MTNIYEKLLDITIDQKNIILKLNDYQFDEEEIISTPNSTWFLLRKLLLDEKTNDYNLKEGDIIKIGRIIIRIKSIKFKKQSESKKNIDLNLNLKEVQTEKNPKKAKDLNEPQQNKACRICYIDEETIDNPLIQPCICSGSMKYIHLNCLKKWLSTSVFIEIESQENFKVYQYRQAECELCKTKFPDFIKHKGKLYEIIDFSNDFNNYLIIESLTLDKMKNKYLYIVNLDNKNNKINIGRGHDSNIILNDISVSRIHCTLNINKNMKKIFISDNNSKFGTLILVQTKNIILSTNLKLHIQIGRSYLEFLLKSSTNIFGCCDVNEKRNHDFYYLQNKDKIILNQQLTIKNEIEKEFGDKDNEEIIYKKNQDETNAKIKEFGYLNTNPNLNEDNLEEILLTPLKVKIEKNKLTDENNNIDIDNNLSKEKEEESIIIDDSIDEDNLDQKFINNSNNNK